MKIAKIFMGDPNNQKGFFNNVIARTKYLLAVEKDVDCYMIRSYFDFILKTIKGNFSTLQKEEYTIIDGIRFKNIWLSISWYDYILTYRLHRKVINSKRKLNRYIASFEKYDLLSVHSVEAIYLAGKVKEKYNIPFVSTWHGSDINIKPLYNKATKNEISKLLDLANLNFFVSEKLKETANKISSRNNKEVLYTGPAKSFFRYSEQEIKSLKKTYNLTTKHVIGFIGNFRRIKNVLILPLVFERLQKIFENNISFILVGNGELEDELNQLLAEKGVNNVQNLGKQSPEKMPNIINCLDVLILPSLNEGMPRVTLEAQACGVYVVGSDRGGIPESIGQENCFALDENFVGNISNRIIEILKNEVPRPTLAEKFSWDRAVAREVEVYREYLSLYR